MSVVLARPPRRGPYLPVVNQQGTLAASLCRREVAPAVAPAVARAVARAVVRAVVQLRRGMVVLALALVLVLVLVVVVVALLL